MSRTAILFQNLTAADMHFGHKNDKDNWGPAYSGTDWNDTVPRSGTTIPVSIVPFQIGSEGDPGSIETDHWGWIYLERSDTQQNLQVFLHLNGKKGIVEVGVSNFDKDSSESNPYGAGSKFSNSPTFNASVINGAVLITMH